MSIQPAELVLGNRETERVVAEARASERTACSDYVRGMAATYEDYNTGARTIGVIYDALVGVADGMDQEEHEEWRTTSEKQQEIILDLRVRLYHMENALRLIANALPKELCAAGCGFQHIARSILAEASVWPQGGEPLSLEDSLWALRAAQRNDE